MAELLRPEADSLHLLEQLVGRRLRKEEDRNLESQERPAPYRPQDDTTAVELPRSGVSFTSQGLFLSYEPGEVACNIPGGVEVTIAYPELLPLLRPTSPVARMLRVRGLWRVSQKQ